ncbi:MAG: Rrf2 family transcriptional regulator [Treponema sp.]|jgi:Rrf2 family protein|nr:Rrf2 family transcriptional regulator [Treponema sp.]
MKISTRGRYGIRLLLDLAEHCAGPHVSLASIAERQNISVRYLEQVVIILRRSGYIRSIKGTSGGYTLTRPPEEIIIGDVLRLLEGDMLVIDPPRPQTQETLLQRCLRLMVYERLNNRIAEAIDNKTLASLFPGSQSAMYYI